MSKIPTAEEFWKEISPNEELGMLADLKKHHLNKHVFEAMRRYAKLHVEAAIKECIESAPSASSGGTTSKYFEKQKLEFAIEQLKRFRECTFGKGIDVIEELKQKLSEL